MTTAIAPTPPPPSADVVGGWEGNPLRRLVFGVDRTVTDSEVRVYTLVSQNADGSIEQSAVDADPSVCVADGERLGLGRLNSDQARELASALLEAAAELDEWVK